MKNMLQDQRGAGHLVLIAGVVVVAVVALTGWWVLSKNKDEAKTSNSSLSQEAATAIKNAKCEYDDKDLCKFFTSWKLNDSYSMTTDTDGGESNGDSMIMKVDGDKSHMTFKGNLDYEVISTGSTTYVKDSSDGKWWKQTLTPTEENASSSFKSQNTPTFDEPAADTVATQYKSLGKEKCGNLTCFKYQVLNAGDNTTEYLWFDDKDYQIRKAQYITDGVTTTTTFAYDKVSIKTPTSTKELGKDQYIVPGQSEPVTTPSVPSQAELDAMMQQYAQ